MAACFFRKRKLDHVLKPLDRAADLEEKYQQKLIAYEELKQKEERELNDVNIYSYYFHNIIIVSWLFL